MDQVRERTAENDVLTRSSTLSKSVVPMKKIYRGTMRGARRSLLQFLRLVRSSCFSTSGPQLVPEKLSMTS